MTSEDPQRHEMICRIQRLLQTFPDEIVEQLVKQWEEELEERYLHSTTDPGPSTTHESSDQKS
ncbi:hypothetical protein FBR02_13895 [Anaerolineae bacterium CFX9]|nr:hypothetical protein [Anaerolineae bacterium CFX9]